VKNPARVLIGAQLLLALAYTLPLFSSELLTDSDFISFYTGWEIVRNGDGPKLYDLELQTAYQSELWGSAGAPFNFRLLPFVNPPHAALIFMPLAYLSPRAAAFVFLGFNCLVGVWVLRRLWQLAAGWSQSARVLLITTILGTEVFWYGLATRTLTLIILACLIEYYRALKGGRDLGAAVWLITATIKPQLILLPAFIPLVRRRWRLIAIAFSLGILIAFCISLGLGFHIWKDYVLLLREVSFHGEAYGASPLLMNNLRMILYRTLPPLLVLPLVYLGLLVGIAATFWLWRSARAFELKFALTLLIGLCLAPHLNYQDTLIAFLPASILYERARLESGGFVKVFPLLLVIATLVPAALIFSGYSRTLRWIWPLPLILILIGLCVRALRVEQKADLAADERG
jgi:Glycosyltransferase family 87